MRIDLVSEHASPLAALGEADAGGQNVHVAALARGLGELGHEVRVYTRRDDAESAERVPLAPTVTVVNVPAGPATHVPKDELLPHMEQFGEWVARDWATHGPPDVAHSHFWMSGLAALQACTASGVPLAHTFHALGTVKRRFQGAADTSPAARLALEAKVGREVDVVVATCTDEVAELEAIGLEGTTVSVVPCGVDTARFKPMDPVALQPDSRASDLSVKARARLLLVGRMVPRKGFDLALHALVDLPEVELVVAGGPPADRLDDDPEARRLRALAAELGVENRLVLTGQVAHEDMPAVYRCADMVLALPWYEPFGITPLEAAACGRPVVGTAVGGLLDSVADGVTGILVPPRDPAAVAGAVRWLLTHPDEAAQMRVAARRRAVDRFDWATVARQTEAVYEHLVTARTPSATTSPSPTRRWLDDHASEVQEGISSLCQQSELVRTWAEHLATRLTDGSRLLVAGNGGSAAEAQHLTAELVGRFRQERRPLSALALTAETSSLTAILNDYGPDEVFARQVEAHGRPGDLLVLLSTSGSSSNVLHAAKRAHELGLAVWSLTGPVPNPLASLSDEYLAVRAPSTAAVQEVHLMTVHALCAALDAVLEGRGRLTARTADAPRIAGVGA
jgi:type III pantothenate kinase